MKKIISRIFLAGLVVAGAYSNTFSQGMHFSQYYNAPILLNPANTALMSENDFRVGVNYRNQWAKIPVPYTTTSAYADFSAFRSMENTNWLGIGFAFFNDKAGDGELSLRKFEGTIAYHLQVGLSSMISVGIGGGMGQRSINYNKLTFNDQWDGFQFDEFAPNNEQNGVINTKYYDVSAGINYAYFPNEFTYVKLGVGVAHLNQPEETFYQQGTVVNNMGIRPTANLDGLFRVSQTFMFNPSAYFTMQKGAYELLFGSLGMIYVGGSREETTQLILGGFYRWDEAAVLALGLQYNKMRFMISYDYTVSKLNPENRGNGAIEIGLSYQGAYGNLSMGRRTINCPRF